MCLTSIIFLPFTDQKQPEAVGQPQRFWGLGRGVKLSLAPFWQPLKRSPAVRVIYKQCNFGSEKAFPLNFSFYLALWWQENSMFDVLGWKTNQLCSAQMIVGRPTQLIYISDIYLLMINTDDQHR